MLIAQLTLNVVLNHRRHFIGWFRELKRSILCCRASQVSSIVFQNLIAHTQTDIVSDRVFLDAVNEDAVSVAAL